MSWQTIQHKEVKIRKPHRCVGCSEKKEKGDKMIYTFSVDGGDISSCYWCLPCNAYFNKYAKDFDYEITEGEFSGEQHYEKFKEEYYQLSDKIKL